MESLDKHIKTRVKLEAFDTKLLTEACKSLIEGISSINGIAKGPIPLPTKKRIYCVLRSPHVDKKSREHFEIRIHKRLLDIYTCLLYTSPSPRDRTRSRMPSSA